MLLDDPAARLRLRLLRARGRALCCDLHRLSEPVLNLGLSEKQTTLVADPVLGRFPRKLAMPLGDFGITSRTKRGHFLQPRRPKLAETRVLHTATVTARKERHRRFVPLEQGPQWS